MSVTLLSGNPGEYVGRWLDGSTLVCKNGEAYPSWPRFTDFQATLLAKWLQEQDKAGTLNEAIEGLCSGIALAT